MSTLRANQIETVNGKIILPSTGSILQVAYGDSTTQVIVPQQLYTIIHSVSLTSVAPNSRYFMTGYAHAYNDTSGTVGDPGARVNIGFSVTIAGTTTRISGVDTNYGDSWAVNSINGVQCTRSAVYTSTAPAGTSITFNLLGASYDYADTYFNYAGYGHKSTLTIMEISA